jgi:hypothetical protein
LKIYQSSSLEKDRNKPDEEKGLVEEWLITIFMEKLRKAAVIAGRKGKPFLLYRNVLEESNEVVQEETATVLDRYVMVQVYTYGGFLPCNFQKQNVYTLDKFTHVILKRNRNLLLQCLENLDT